MITEGRAKTILVAEDLEEFRRPLVEALSGEGYRVKTAASGEDLLASLAETKPDLILLDLSLEGKDGVSCLRELRERFPPEKCPVIVLSAHTEPLVVQTVRRLGADGFCSKSDFSLAALLETVKNVIFPKSLLSHRLSGTDATSHHGQNTLRNVEARLQPGFEPGERNVDAWG